MASDGRGDKDMTPGEESPGFGPWLKALRESKNVSLEEIAAVTKIHIVQLQHLESDEIEKLPSLAFVRGFLVSYARHLDVDEDEILERFKTFAKVEGSLSRFRKKKPTNNAPNPKVKMVQAPPLKKAPGANKQNNAKKSLPLNKKHFVFAFVFALLVGALSLLVSLGTKNPGNEAGPAMAEVSGPRLPETQEQTESAAIEEEAEEKVKAEEAPEPVAQAPASPPPQREQPKVEEKPQPTPPPPPRQQASTTSAPVNMEVKGIDSSWIKIRVDDKSPEGLQLEEGKTSRYTVKEKIVLSLSNAGAVEIKWNGQWYEPPGFRGDVKSITLPDQLGSLKKKQ